MADIDKNNKEYRLNNSKVFCMAPWVSINNNPNGDIQPCCIARDATFGNLYKDAIEDIWNNDKYKDFRKRMLNDEKSPECQRCYKEEEWGNTSNYRKYWNELYSSKYNQLIEETRDDGSLNIMNLYRWDFRFSNMCNLSCVGCGPSLSSSWVDLQKKMWTNDQFKIYTSRDKRDQFIETIKSQATNVDNIYFAGGEPLIHSEHYEIINELERLNKLDKVDFMYSTNLTNLYFKNQYIVDYWRKMKRCKVLVSIDEVDHNRLYYLRYPSKSDEIFNNIKTISKTLNTVKKSWSITPTWSVLNTHRMKDIIDYFYNNNLLPESFSDSASWEIDMNNIILMYPSHMSITNATPEWKKHLHTKLNEFEEWYNDVLIPLKNPNVKFFSSKILKGNIEKFRNALNEEGDGSRNFLQWWERLDAVRKTNFRETFPELNWYMDLMK